MGATSAQRRGPSFTARGLELNSVLFPAPKPSYSKVELEDELLFVPRMDRVYKTVKVRILKKLSPAIPCLYLKARNNIKRKTLLYFHGNAEDIALAKDLIYDIHVDLNVN